MRLAFLLHGQARNIDKTFELLNEVFFKKYDFDVYCQVWWDNEVKKNGYFSRDKNYVVDPNSIDKIIDFYNPVKLLIEKNLYVDRIDQSNSEIFKLYPNLLSYKSCPSSVDSLSQFLSIRNVSNLINFEDYDMIIKWRYDFAPVNFPNLNELEKNKFYVSSDYYGTFQNDETHFIDATYILPNNMQNMTKIFDYMVEDSDGITPKIMKCPEDVYSEHLIKFNHLEKMIKLPYQIYTTIKI